jgi:hypothetical protein
MLLLYSTIWLALILFVAGDSGRSLTPRGLPPPRWAWWAFVTGLALAAVHTLLAFGIVHGWSHNAALERTAIQTQRLYGAPLAGGLYVNYLFLAVWFADAMWWRSSPSRVRPTAAVWFLRAFYMLILFNAAVVFASAWRRIAGVALVSWLVRAWTAPAVALDRERSLSI